MSSSRHVRFAESVGYAATPSPSHSVSSLPSSYGPWTPPNAFNGNLPLGAPMLHPVLSFAGPEPNVAFNISLPVANIRPMKNIAPSVLLEDATFPRLPSLVLTHPRLFWTITVEPAEGNFVLVRDVFNAIYTSLRQQASAAEYERLGSEAQRQVTKAFTKRYSRMPNAQSQTFEKSKGLKRVDFLGSMVTFMGLNQSQMGPNCWDLVLA
ncbi:hypothetical protein C8F04DRAFT_1180547 [Mycena alexandri]|uniref:DUF6699 domain-containing protein n=1 Tax=Mycena alexandri TaxID=1745969 RepID=A0AAD6T0I6_9AGAR|nr:hypothetical protein C8F04DRAFT_1180547 [Mycena alexandri]